MFSCMHPNLLHPRLPERFNCDDRWTIDERVSTWGLAETVQLALIKCYRVSLLRKLAEILPSRCEWRKAKQAGSCVLNNRKQFLGLVVVNILMTMSSLDSGELNKFPSHVEVTNCVITGRLQPSIYSFSSYWQCWKMDDYPAFTSAVVKMWS